MIEPSDRTRTGDKNGLSGRQGRISARLERFQYAWRGWILAALFTMLVLDRLLSGSPLKPAWLALIAMGLFWRLYAGAHIKGHSNGSILGADHLARSGPYRLGRHPLYFSNLLVSAGLILYANSLPAWGGCLLLLLVFAHHNGLARAEERHLADKWGETYRRYLQATSRWIGFPGRIALVPGVETVPDLSPDQPARIPGVLSRQVGNLGKTVAAVLILWAVAGLGQGNVFIP